MSRLLLLLIFGIWMTGSIPLSPWRFGATTAITVFLGGYVVLLVSVAIWARLLSGQVERLRLHSNLRRFNRGLSVARGIVPAWLAIAMFGPCAWGDWVHQLLGHWTTISLNSPSPQPLPLAVPGLLLGTLPALLAWMGLWWAQFPADRALREQTLLDQLEADLPIHSPPRFWPFFTANFRQQILFILLPVLLIMALRDLGLGLVAFAGWRVAHPDNLESWIMLPAAAAVFILAPELLRRVLDTRPLPPSSLRNRLVAICNKLGLRYREILLWQTQYSMGNAAVMGLLPQLRYILLSDLLLETLSDEQIEAVLAHEAGHIVHRHMLWYAIFFVTLTLITLGPGKYLENWPPTPQPAGNWVIIRDAVMGLGGLATIIALFGFISRRFERQADVFAARMIQNHNQPGDRPANGSPPPPWTTPVGPYGAQIFAAALQRVAIVNNIPIAARSWCHGSIAKRMNYVHHLADSPQRTGQFDQVMLRLYAGILLVAAICAVMVTMR